MSIDIRALAFYLPQYHPIPENDLWWGKGFTEWTNVTKAQPMFKNHYQPRYPADLGYYDLRLPEIREQQADMARAYGIEGFVYYHYWFGNKKRLLERPFDEVLKSGKPNFPFCLCWANETWRGVWFGEFTDKLLIEQTYPGRRDYTDHFYHLLPAFRDERYIKVNGKPVFNVYMPLNVPDIKEFTGVFNDLAIKEGLPGIFFVASRCPLEWNPLEHGFDGVIGSEVATIRYRGPARPPVKHQYTKKKLRALLDKVVGTNNQSTARGPVVVNYADVIDQLITDKQFNFDYYPCVVPNWDNTARAGEKGLVFHNSTPQLFVKHLQKALKKVEHLLTERRFIFIKSWNEWAEGNYLEPDKKFGYEYLEAFKQTIENYQS